VNSRLSTTAALACLVFSGCSSTVAGTAAPAAPAPITTPEALPGLLLQAADIGAAMSSDDLVVTRDSGNAWSDTARLTDLNCLPIAGAAQQAVYSDSDSTAIHSQILREPPTAPAWNHYVVQAVALFPDAAAAASFYATSRGQWDQCSNRQMTYPQPVGPNQVWTIGPTSSDHDILSVSRTEQSPEKWACQRALTVHNNVAIDIEACSQDGLTTAAVAIARQISSRLPAA
jgi:hypothetical protein